MQLRTMFKGAAEMPYFEGDFWPNVLEESIKELDQEEEEKRKREEAEAAAAEEADLTAEIVEGPDVSCFLAHLVMSLCNHALSVVVGFGVCVQPSQ